jgi:ATP-dependent Clp protease protease subunit
MIDLIKSSNKQTSTIGVGIQASCGAILLASGEKGMRFASDSSRILIHQVSGGSFGKTSDIQADSDQIRDLNELIFRKLAEYTGNSVDKFKNEVKNRENADWVLSPQEALKWGIIDYIGLPRTTHPPYKMTLELFKNPISKGKTKRAVK